MDLYGADGLTATRVASTHGGEYAGPCPSCGGTDRFRLWPEQNDGQGSYWCRSCGCGGDAIQYLRDHHGMGYREACDYLGTEPTGHAAPPPPHISAAQPGRAQTIVATYDYQDAAGKLLYQVVRYSPKTFRQRQPDGDGGWAYHLRGIEPVLYRLPDVTEAQQVLLVEGEKDVDTTTDMGYAATTAPMGAGKWHESYTAALAGKDVVIVPDQDEPGRKHADRVAQALRPVCRSVRQLDLPQKDLTAWVEAGGTADQLREMVESAGDCAPPPTLTAVGYADFLSLQLPERATIMDPILPAQSLSMVYAPAGTGKTYLMMGLACAVARGSNFLGWEGHTPHKVLYLDFEMPAAAMQKRVAGIVAGMDPPPDPDNLRLFTPDLQDLDRPLPDLSMPGGQQEIDVLAGDADLLIVDNVSAAMRTGKENEAEGWIPVQTWALRQRAAGRSVIFVHHAGKGGQQRGSSKKTDLLDLVLQLRRPADYDPTQGAKFEVHIEKGRHLQGDDTEAIEAALVTAPDGSHSWTWRTLAQGTMERVASLVQEGLTQAEIAEELNLHKSNVSRAIKKARANGLIV